MNNRGYLIVAQNTTDTDYLRCARVLAASIRRVETTARITLLTDQGISDSNFEHVIIFPHGDRCVNQRWKLANDWQVYDASPYEYTIKLEADMYIPRSIEHWWDCLYTRDLHICTTIRNFRGDVSDCRQYRGTIDKNRLPDTYNAITYWRRSALAATFYSIVRDVFENWAEYTADMMLARDEIPTTDIVYAIAARIIGVEHCTLPKWKHISMTHMKKAINDGRCENWTRELLAEIHPDVLRINTYPQLYPFHYHIKDFADTLEQAL